MGAKTWSGRCLDSSQVQGQKVKGQGHQLINAETEIVSATNFKLSRWLEHVLSTVMASYKGL